MARSGDPSSTEKARREPGGVAEKAGGALPTAAARAPLATGSAGADADAASTRPDVAAAARRRGTRCSRTGELPTAGANRGAAAASQCRLPAQRLLQFFLPRRGIAAARLGCA